MVSRSLGCLTLNSIYYIVGFQDKKVFTNCLYRTVAPLYHFIQQMWHNSFINIKKTSQHLGEIRRAQDTSLCRTSVWLKWTLVKRTSSPSFYSSHPLWGQHRQISSPKCHHEGEPGIISSSLHVFLSQPKVNGNCFVSVYCFTAFEFDL